MPEIIVKLGDSIVQKNIFVKETIRIGRVPDNEIVVENLAVSRYHAVIECEDGHYLLTDLDSSNGTFVNGVRVKKTELQDRDVVTIGKHKLYFYDHRSMAELKPRPIAVDIERTMLIDAAPPAPTQAELEVVKGRQEGTRFVLSGVQTSIGKGAFNDIQLTDWFVSKMHAVIERRGNQFFIRDMGSWRHTFVNGVLTQEAPLAEGDTIQLGPSVQLAFRLARPEASSAAAARVPVELDPAAPPRPAPEPESASEHGEATSKVWRPRYVEWHDPVEAASEPQAANSQSEPEPVSSNDLGDSAPNNIAQSPWSAPATPGIQDGVYDDASAFVENTQDEPDEEDAAQSEIETPVMSVMHQAGGDSDALDGLDKLAPPASPYSQPEPEFSEAVPEPPLHPASVRRRSALEELASALCLDEEPMAPAPASHATGPEALEPAVPAMSERLPEPLTLELAITPASEPQPARDAYDPLSPALDLAPESAQNASDPDSDESYAEESIAAPEASTPDPEAFTSDPEGVQPCLPADEPLASDSPSEPIKLWTAPPEEDNNEPEGAPDDLPGEIPEEIPSTAVQEETDPEVLREILMWERALKNKNPIIRKQAARQLQKLTGKDYDYA